MKMPLLISVFSHLPIYATTLYSCWRYKKLPHELKLFSWFLFITSIIQLCSLILALLAINNMPFLHLYVLTSFALLAWFYADVLRDFINRKIIWICLGLFTVFAAVNTLFFQPLFTFASNALTAEAVLIIIFSLSTFMLFLNESVKENKKGLGISINWINSGLFVYYTSNLLIYYFGNVITHVLPQKFNLYAWMFHSFFSVIMYCCFFIGLWKYPKD